LKIGSVAASTAASAIANAAIGNPAITALTATSRTVTSVPLGKIAPRTSLGSRPEARTRSSTRCGVGKTIGNPSPNEATKWS
jgi:hypothetical protein